LHLPTSLAVLDLVGRLLPGVPAVASFDTAFHSGLPAAAATYALPEEWRARWGLRRFGFHGLSHAWASRRAAELAARPVGSLRTVTCHLGAGASLAAVSGGTSVDTTMGFTPLEGLVMATRSGTVDPGLVLWLEEACRAGAQRTGFQPRAPLGAPRAVRHRRNARRPRWRSRRRRGGHLGRRRLPASAACGDLHDGGRHGRVGRPGLHRGRRRRAPSIRSRAIADLAFLGVVLDEEVNSQARPDLELTGTGSEVRSFLVEGREDLQIAHEVRDVLATRGCQFS
jgi:acetate kinase